MNGISFPFLSIKAFALRLCNLQIRHMHNKDLQGQCRGTVGIISQLSHSSRITNSNQSSRYHVAFLWVLWFPPTSQQHDDRWIGYSELPPGLWVHDLQRCSEYSQDRLYWNTDQDKNVYYERMDGKDLLYLLATHQVHKFHSATGHWPI